MEPVLSLLGVFPASAALQFQSVILEPGAVTFVLRTTNNSAAYPVCGGPSVRVHSHYQRRLTDLPWQGRAIHLQIHARRFFCEAPECPRCIFTERLPEFVAPQQRTTTRLHSTHTQIGFALGGEAGARLAANLVMPTSPDTLLRRVR